MFGSLLAEKRDSASISLKNLPRGLESLFGGGPTSSGVTVTEERSLGLPVVWACIDIIARTVASFPLPVYERLDPKGKNRVPNHPVAKLMQRNSNPEQTAYMWKHMMSVHQNLWGVGISEIEFDSQGQPIALWPIPPWRVKPVRTKEGELVYKVTLPKQAGEKTLIAAHVVIFQSMTTSRDNWMSPIAVHRETIGAAHAVKEFGSRTFSQGVNPAGVLTGVKFGREESQKTLREKYSGYEGLGASHRLMFVEEGTEFKRIGLPPEDAQYLETRQADIGEIARIYHMPLFMLQEHTKSTSWGTGLEEMKNGFVTFTMRPNCIQWEQELNKKLIFKDRFFIEFLLDGLLRGNIKDRFKAYKDGFAMGVYDIDEIREMENRNPLPDEEGKARFVPMNMITLEKAVLPETEPKEIDEDLEEEEEDA